MTDVIRKTRFKDLDLDDNFFDSLKEDYKEFERWFRKKSLEGAEAFVLQDNGLQGFLYLKIENESNEDISPILKKNLRLKIGTFKINAHGTKLGERFIKIIIDTMKDQQIDEAYVTVFKKHVELINLLKEYGFIYYGIKKSINGVEDVYIKKFSKVTGNIYLDYPRINISGNNKFLLSIYPKFHTKLFPDSKLKTEKNHVIKDISYTNSIKKIYLSGSSNLINYKKGDLIVIYRTKEIEKPAEYTAVATSICTVESIKNIYEFNNYSEFFEYCNKHSVFSTNELKNYWETKKYPYIVTMLYNIAMNKRIIRKKLIEEVGLERDSRWVVVPLSDEQFTKILEMGEVDENLIID